MEDLRFECQDCGVKWFVPAHRASAVEPADCAACGGTLIPLSLGDPPLGWRVQPGD